MHEKLAETGGNLTDEQGAELERLMRTMPEQKEVDVNEVTFKYYRHY
jgi:hypothetical protein